jgi:glutathione S-transferase
MFAAEKGIELALVEVGDRAELKSEFLTRSTHRLVPMLELDDGTLIGEAAAICRYLEALHPEPPLFGRDAKQAALIDMWERKAELEGIQAVGEVFRNTLPVFADRGLGGYAAAIPQIPALIERGKLRVAEFHDKLDRQLAGHAFVVGDALSIADITALCAIDFGRRVKLEIPERCVELRRWHADVSARPSARA